jgi:FkbM family methyltransferase
MRKYTYNFIRFLTRKIPKGKSFLINSTLKLLGNEFNDSIKLSDGRKFFINKITDINRSLFFLGKYEGEETALLRKILKPGDYTIVVGANFGYYTTLMSSLVKNSGKVFAFDIVPEIIKNLELNIKLNNSLYNVRMELIALGDKRGKIASFYSTGQGSGNLNSDLLRTGIKLDSIPMDTLDSYIHDNDKPRVDFIKCDIDGYEVPFLRGARNTINKFKPKILIELCEQSQRAFGHSRKELLGLLKDYGYGIERLDGKDIDRDGNVFCVPVG